MLGKGVGCEMNEGLGFDEETQEVVTALIGKVGLECMREGRNMERAS